MNPFPPRGVWDADLLDVCSSGCSVCCCSFLCPCLQYGANAELAGDRCFASCCLYMILMTCGMPCCLHAPFRRRVREFNVIQSEYDWCVTSCCIPCALIQEAKQLVMYPMVPPPYGINNMGQPRMQQAYYPQPYSYPQQMQMSQVQMNQGNYTSTPTPTPYPPQSNMTNMMQRVDAYGQRPPPTGMYGPIAPGTYMSTPDMSPPSGVSYYNQGSR